MIVTIILTSVLLGLFWIFYRQRKEKMMVFKRMGIPGPEPNFLFGNLLAFKDKPLYAKQMEWREEYGETYGYFEGPSPVLVTSNLDMLQEVFIKQFNKFHARKLWPVQVDPDVDEDVHLFFARGRRWKRLRNIVTPAFSAAKMRSMAPTVNDCINHLLDVIRDKSQSKDMDDQSLEVLELFRRMTLDTILRCEMGIDQNSVKDPEDLFLRHCKGIIEDTSKTPWLYTLGFIFPALHCLWMAVYRLLHNIQFNPVFWIEAKMREVVDIRRNHKGDRQDLMQQMLNAQDSVDHFKDLDLHEDKPESKSSTAKAMTSEEIVSHALLFLLAGYETTSTTLAYVFYELSQNPHVQHRLRQDVMTILPRGYHDIDFDDLKKLKYLDCVIWETLRKYPLASTVTARQCMTPCKVGGIDIPPGMLIHANLWDVQYDTRYWGEDTHAFDPSRFTTQNRKNRHPMAWMPFGGGPRACAGIQFAYLQLKMVVAKLLRDFDFRPSHHLSVPLDLMQGATITPAEGVHLSAMRRGSAMSENAGSRRGSIMAAFGLEEWNSARRQSVQEEEEREDGEDVKRFYVNDDDVLDANGLRRASNPKIVIQGLQSDSDAFDANIPSDSENLIRRDSINLGLELLRRSSLSKGFEILLKSSDWDSNSDGDLSRRSSVDSTVVQAPCVTSTEQPPWTLPVDDSMNNNHNNYNNKCRRMSRRGSAFPVLESVWETNEMTSFTPPFTEQMGKSTMTWQRKIEANRLEKRRGSG